MKLPLYLMKKTKTIPYLHKTSLNTNLRGKVSTGEAYYLHKYMHSVCFTRQEDTITMTAGKGLHYSIILGETE